MIEFALMVPLLFLLVVNVVNFGSFLYAWITISGAARTAADYAILGSASAGSPGSPTTAQITTLVTTDTSSLRGTTPAVCVNKNTTASAISGTCPFAIASIPPDPESSTYSLAAVDLKYTFTPLIPLFSFPQLGIHATIPPTVIQRRALMRVAN